MFRIGVLSIAVTVLLASSAIAQSAPVVNPENQAGTLKALCETPRTADSAINGYADCLWYIQGFLEGHIALARITVPRQQSICLPNRLVSGNELRLVFVNWLSAHPDQLTEFRMPVMMQALSEAFPCAPAGKQP